MPIAASTAWCADAKTEKKASPSVLTVTPAWDSMADRKRRLWSSSTSRQRSGDRS